MRRLHLLASVVLALALVVPASSFVSASPLPFGQEGQAAQEAAEQSTEKKVLTIDDYARWRSVVSTGISADGEWVSFGYRKREADDELHIKSLSSDAEHVIEKASNPQLSENGRWVAYQLALGWEEIEKLEDDDKPVPVQAELLNLASGEKFNWDNVDRFEMAKSSLALVVKRKKADGAGGGGARGGAGGSGGGGGRGGSDDSAAERDADPRGTDMIVRYLRRGFEELLGSIDEFAFNKPGTHLAYTVDAADNNGNGVFVLHLATGMRRGLDNDKAEYARLTWDEEGMSLAVLKGKIPEGMEERQNVLLGFRDVGIDQMMGQDPHAMMGGMGEAAHAGQAGGMGEMGGEGEAGHAAQTGGEGEAGHAAQTGGMGEMGGMGGAHAGDPNKILYDPSTDEAFPEGFVISQRGTLSWNEGLSKVFFGIKEQAEEPEETEDPIADVNILRWNDERTQWVQQKSAERDRNFTYKSVVNLDGGDGPHFVRLADERMRTVNPTKNGRWAIGEDNKEYISDWKPGLADYYRIDTASGERARMLEGFERRHAMGASPNGKHFLYWQGEQVWDWPLDMGEPVNLTASAPVSFTNTEWDYTTTVPSYGLAGWAKDGSGVVLNHQYDLYFQPLDGSAATNLTGGIGTEEEIRFRHIDLDPDRPGVFFGGRRFGGGPSKIDLTKPMLLSAFGKWTKKAGFYELEPGWNEPVVLMWDEMRFNQPLKAKNVDRFYYTAQDFQTFPDWWVVDWVLTGEGHKVTGDGRYVDLMSTTRITDANPWQSEYKWGHRVLFDYTNNDGVRLQGILAIPDDYQEGEKRPMIVRFYEKMSDELHSYPTPMYRHQPNFAGYVSAGYLLMQPDVHFRGRTSHSDMLECVEAATQKVIDLGYADPAAVGLSGHSYSGGGSSYIAGTSDMFAAVASGAAPINLTSEFNQVFLGSGQNNHSYDIYGQGRYGTDPYADPELYEQQSPITFAPEMDTPLLYLHGEEDPTVGYYQAMEWYNALRFNEKPIYFLSYPGEGHGLRKYENQLDFQLRLREFFNHFLRDEEPPRWIVEGVTFLEKERNLKRRKK